MTFRPQCIRRTAAVIRRWGVAQLPAGISFAVGIAATTALQALRDHGELQPG